MTRLRFRKESWLSSLKNSRLLRRNFTNIYIKPICRDPITLSEDDCNHLLSKDFRFHYHSQKVIGSLGIVLIFNCINQKCSGFYGVSEPFVHHSSKNYRPEKTTKWNPRLPFSIVFSDHNAPFFTFNNWPRRKSSSSRREIFSSWWFNRPFEKY